MYLFNSISVVAVYIWVLETFILNYTLVTTNNSEWFHVILLLTCIILYNCYENY